MRMLLMGAALAACCQPLHGREARLESFSENRASQFVVLAPSDPVFDASAEITAEITSDGPVVVQPERAFAAVPPLPYGAEVNVPRWMRTGEVSPADLSPGVWALNSKLRCDTPLSEPIHPIDGLSAIAKARRRQHFEHLSQAACNAGVPLILFDALIGQESRYNHLARSSAGAMGLAQLMPATARYLRVANPWDPLQSLQAGAHYLRRQYDRFGSWALALAAYNAGPGNVEKYRGVPPFRETRDYVHTILAKVARQDAAVPSGSSARSTSPFARVRLVSYSPGSDVPED